MQSAAAQNISRCITSGTSENAVRKCKASLFIWQPSIVSRFRYVENATEKSTTGNTMGQVCPQFWNRYKPQDCRSRFLNTRFTQTRLCECGEPGLSKGRRRVRGKAVGNTGQAVRWPPIPLCGKVPEIPKDKWQLATFLPYYCAYHTLDERYAQYCAHLGVSGRRAHHRWK